MDRRHCGREAEKHRSFDNVHLLQSILGGTSKDVKATMAASQQTSRISSPPRPQDPAYHSVDHRVPSVPSEHQSLYLHAPHSSLSVASLPPSYASSQQHSTHPPDLSPPLPPLPVDRDALPSHTRNQQLLADARHPHPQPYPHVRPVTSVPLMRPTTAPDAAFASRPLAPPHRATVSSATPSPYVGLRALFTDTTEPLRRISTLNPVPELQSWSVPPPAPQPSSPRSHSSSIETTSAPPHPLPFKPSLLNLGTPYGPAANSITTNPAFTVSSLTLVEADAQPDFDPSGLTTSSRPRAAARHSMPPPATTSASTSTGLAALFGAPVAPPRPPKFALVPHAELASGRERAAADVAELAAVGDGGAAVFELDGTVVVRPRGGSGAAGPGPGRRGGVEGEGGEDENGEGEGEGSQDEEGGARLDETPSATWFRKSKMLQTDPGAKAMNRHLPS